MRAVFILFAIFGLTAVEAGSASDPETYAASRILGGRPVPISDYQFVISLRTLSGVHFCSGFIHNPRWIVTTATCALRRSLGDFTARMDTNSLKEDGTILNIDDVKPHPDYNEILLTNNIALLHTVEVTTELGVGHLRISDQVAPVGTVAEVTGWGRTTVMIECSQIGH